MTKHSFQIAAILVALAVALATPLFAGPFWLTLITQIYIYGLLALSVDLLLGHAGLYSLCQASFFAVAAYTTAILQVRYGKERGLAERIEARMPEQEIDR
jgi:branched-chain amino acid transport system permease protein